MGKSSKEKLVLDTSALISLGTVKMICEATSIAKIVVSSSVIKEIEEFAKFGDDYGQAAQRPLT